MIYTQLIFSRTDGRSWDRGVAGFGEEAKTEARDMARDMTRAGSVDFIEVTIEDRRGATTVSSETLVWSRAKGWQTK